jgi:hypothetical protein
MTSFSHCFGAVEDSLLTTATNRPMLLRYRSGLRHMPYTAFRARQHWRDRWYAKEAWRLLYSEVLTRMSA